MRVIEIDLPELTSIQMGISAFTFKYDASSTLIVQSTEMNVN